MFSKGRKKALVALLIFIGLCVFLFWYLFWPRVLPSPEKISWGVTFTKSYAEYLGLDWRKTYLAILDELKPKAIRIGINWDEIEKEPYHFDFSDYDWMFEEAALRNIEILPVVGFKLPRWPECRAPSWTKSLSEKDFEERQFVMMKEVVEHFKNYPNIKTWQMENEAFIEWFGDCPTMKDSLAYKKVKFLRFLDPSRPILLTESGELSSWFRSALVADQVGISIYRQVYNRFWGYSSYWYISPSFYHQKSNLVNFVLRIIGKKPVSFLVTELQGEAWAPQGITNLSIEEQLKNMGPKQISDIFNFARQTGFTKIYVWGAEWWYWLKEKGYPEIWQLAIKEFQS